MKLHEIPDQDLVARFSDLLMEEKEALVLQLEFLVELDRRKLFFSYPSLWAYLVHEHRMEESTAERRIRAARLMKRLPGVKRLLESGKLNLSLLEIAQAISHREKLSDEELIQLLERISGMSSRQARREAALLYPQSVEEIHDRVRPITRELSEVRFAAPQELLDKLDDIRGILAHSHPGASLAELIDVIATDYHNRHHPEEKAKRAQERQKVKNTPLELSPSASKAPSQSMIHALVLKDEYRCSYRDEKTGQRCNSMHGLQIDHIQSWSSGGVTELQNLRFLCRGHHRRVSFLEFGESSKYFRPRHQG